MDNPGSKRQSTTPTEAPAWFRCPISMEVMKDPVTVSTGITYERESIETWIHKYKHRTCPATNQTLTTLDLVPNNTLLRIINAWTTSVNAASTPPAPAADATELSVLFWALDHTQNVAFSLRRLRSIARSDDSNPQTIAAVRGSVSALINVVHRHCRTDSDADVTYCEEALKLLNMLPIEDHRNCLSKPSVPAALQQILRQSRSMEARVQAVLFLDRITAFVDLKNFSSLEDFRRLGGLLGSEAAHQVVMAVVRVLQRLCRESAEKVVMALKAGAVSRLVEMLAETPSTATAKCEQLLAVLHVLAKCRQGRSALAKNALTVPAISEKLLRVSEVASRESVGTLWCLSVVGVHARRAVVDDMVAFGTVMKVCMVVQMEFDWRTKRMAKDIMNVLARMSIGSPCVELSSIC